MSPTTSIPVFRISVVIGVTSNFQLSCCAEPKFYCGRSSSIDWRFDHNGALVRAAGKINGLLTKNFLLGIESAKYFFAAARQ
jgi:hypothetical protein